MVSLTGMQGTRMGVTIVLVMVLVVWSAMKHDAWNNILTFLLKDYIDMHAYTTIMDI